VDPSFMLVFCITGPATTELYTLSLHDALPIYDVAGLVGQRRVQGDEVGALQELVELDLLDAEIARTLLGQERIEADHLHAQALRSEEHTSELQSRENLVCRLLLEKKNR